MASAFLIGEEENDHSSTSARLFSVYKASSAKLSFVVLKIVVMYA